MECAIVEYLANAFWQVPLLVAGVAALLWALGADVQTRHRVWLAVLAVALLLPLRGMEFGEAPTQERIVATAPTAMPVAFSAAEADVAVTPIQEQHKPAPMGRIVLGCAATS